MQGDLAEAQAFLEVLRAGGIEVLVGGRKDRGEFVHQYAVIKMADYAPAAAPPAGPVRVPAVQGRALPGSRRPRRRG
ncbi:hypothetical protein [Dactylosporangium sp. CA-092794]|uniref:hypothetical protein n=1 Tax=Dactylosporangium sp. CA-092794 TaxID=3239929 RepID=UPI003D8F33A3